MQIRWGILGTGNIAKQFARGLKQSRNGKLQAVGTRSRESGDAFAKEIQLPMGVMPSYDDFINDPDVDAVYISLPNTMHHEWTIKALRAGKHVLCEKPIAPTAEQAEEMFAVASETGRVLIEAFMYRCHPQTIAVVDAVRRGAIGRPRLIRTSFCFRTTKIDGNIRFDPKLAGGALMDVGCYCTSFSRLIAGTEPISSQAVGYHHNGVDVAVSGSLLFPNELTASFTCAMNTQADNALLICGEEGWIKVAVPWKPTSVSSGYTIERQAPPKQDAAAAARPPSEFVPVPVEGDVYAIEADAFSDVVAGKMPPFVSAKDSIENIRLLQHLQFCASR